ncbi:MAG: DDE-type integrase/transposase/recombinase [Methanoregula sp.]|nr:DDE-type integrase/transposase/recombinase [Methanoregula sp.]
MPQKFEPLTTTREERGEAITKKKGQIWRYSDSLYRVKSQSGRGSYQVKKTDLGWSCACPDHQTRGVECKHIIAVKLSFAIRKQVETTVRIAPVSQTADLCVYCGSSIIVKDGIRHNDYGDVQTYYCKECQQHFTLNTGFEGMKTSPQDITSAMQLYFSGLSFRNVTKALKLRGVKVSHVAVYKWINKYVSLMKQYIEKIKPQVSDTWRADEIYVKIKGNMKYVFAVMDDETRYWIAQEVAGSKFRHDAAKIFGDAKEVAGKRPNVMITDGLPAYHDAFNRELFTVTNPRSRHVNAIKLTGNAWNENNNKMERLNGSIRDREKTMRGIKKVDTKVLTGMQIYHNYIRPHEALDGKTPAEACGIVVEGENKWITLIQNAATAAK